MKTRCAVRSAGLAAAAGACLLDQASKIWLIQIFGIGRRQPIRLLPFFDVVLVWNKGVSYSLLWAASASGRWLLLAGTLAITAGLLVWMWRSTRLSVTLAIGLIVGGALGNAIDRLFYGAVADFFFFHVGAFRWYIFNLADCAIVAGVAGLLLDSFLTRD